MSHVENAVSELLLIGPRVNFICPVNDEDQFQSVLVTSLKENRYKSLTKIVGATSAAQAFKAATAKDAQLPAGDISVFVHQDAYLPPNWTDRTESIFDNVKFGVAGCVGCAGTEVFGDVYANPTSYLASNVEQLPAKVDSLDEMVLIFPSDTRIRLDPDLGWHMYGADACKKAKELGQDAVVIRNRVVHCSRRVGFGPDVYESARVFSKKYPGAIKTTAVKIDELGNIT